MAAAGHGGYAGAVAMAVTPVKSVERRASLRAARAGAAAARFNAYLGHILGDFRRVLL